MRGNCVLEEMLLAGTKRVLWLKQDSWPRVTGHPGDILRELRSINKLCMHQSEHLSPG